MTCDTPTIRVPNLESKRLRNRLRGSCFSGSDLVCFCLIEPRSKQRSGSRGSTVVTMADVARLADVSESTVSHVLNETRIVRTTTAERVNQAIRTLGYSPNTIARSLARSSTMSIGVALSDIANHYFSGIVHGIESATSAQGYMLLLANTHDDATEELRVVRELQQRRVDGVILSVSGGAPNPALSHLMASDVPVVIIDRLIDAPVDQVGLENKRAAAELVGHLVQLGHRRIGFLSGLAQLSTSQERLLGYRAAMRRAGLTLDPALERAGNSRSEEARLATHQLLAMQDPPTAIIGGNNLMTLGAMRALSERSLRVPLDMAVVSFDDFEWADLFSPRLTTMAQPAEEIGRRAVDLLVQRINEPGHPPRVVRLRGQLRVRESCGTGLPQPQR